MTKRELAAGSKAPAFELAGADGRPVRLSDFAGRWLVLYFYPRADTPGCTVEACEFTERAPQFRKAGADVLGVSPDEPPALAKFIAKHKLGVLLAGDPSKEMLQAYGAWGEKVLYGRKFLGVRRSTVLIDPQGRIAHRWKAARAKGHAEHVRARLAELRAK